MYINILKYVIIIFMGKTAEDLYPELQVFQLFMKKLIR